MKNIDQATNWSQLIHELGTVGLDLTQLNAAEGSAGNLSAYAATLDGLGDAFESRIEYALPVEVPALAGGWVIVTGTGCRLRDLARAPKSNVGLLRIHADGKTATLQSQSGFSPTSELNSHLAVHNDHVARGQHAFHAVVHAQPRFLTYLSHQAAYQTMVELNRRLLRWEPETILTFPEGIGTIPFRVPGTDEMMIATTEALRTHRAVVWQRHGIMTRSAISMLKASDMVEYAEAAAHFEYLNLQLGEPSQGISPEEMKRMCDAWGISLSFLQPGA
jgi:rhamnulose-1-phosphate aldolase